MKTVTSSLRSSESAFSGLGISLGSVALGNVLSAVVALVICIILAKVIISLLGKILEKSKLDKTMHAFIKSAAKVILTVLSAIIVFGSLGFETSSLVALLSVAGLAISLALQNSLSNLAGGVMLLVTKPVEVGDFVEVGGITGTILEIGLTYIYGIGLSRSQEVLKKTGINPDTRVKDLTDEQVQAIRNAIDGYTLEGDLRREVALNIKRLTEIGCYRGLRHRRGLPVRGQRTKTNARTRKGPRKLVSKSKK